MTRTVTIAATDSGMRQDRPVAILEIRTYQLLPDTREDYDRLFRDAALPLLRHFAIDVVAAGPSLGDPNGYFLIRSFEDLSDRERREERFYSSTEWRDGPRQAVVEKIEVYTDAVIALPAEVIEALRVVLSR